MRELLVLVLLLAAGAYAVSVSVSTDKVSYYIGEEVEISGSSDEGQQAIIAVNGQIVANVSISGKSFSCTWDTTSKLAGKYVVSVWIVPTSVGWNYVPAVGACCYETIVSQGIAVNPDASTAFLLLNPTLNVSISPNPVAEKDQVTISGTATGQKYVYVWVFDEKGTTAGGRYWYSAIPVESDWTFNETLPPYMSGELGEYTVFVQALGRDARYSTTGNETPTTANFEGLDNKMGANILDVLIAKATAAGSDDSEVYSVLSYKVAPAEVKLNPIKIAKVNEDLKVEGTTNRIDGTQIVLTLERGGDIIDMKLVSVSGGNFSATFPASSIDRPGNYTVVADDLRGCRSEISFDAIIPPKFEFLNLTVPDRVAANQTVNVTLRLINLGGSGRDFVNITVDGETKCSYEPFVLGNQTVDIVCSFLIPLEGLYQISAGNMSASINVTTPVVAEEARSAEFIEAGTVAATIFSKVIVESIALTLQNTVFNVSVTIQELARKPANVEAPPGVAYSYFEIIPSNFTNADIKDIGIKFKVSRKWLEENKLKPENVKLAVYKEGKWMTLETKVIEADEDIHFVATAPSFSTYTVIGSTPTPTQAPAPARKRVPGMEMGAAIFALLALALILSRLSSRRE